jgi:hypothetical protein
MTPRSAASKASRRPLEVSLIRPKHAQSVDSETSSMCEYSRENSGSQSMTFDQAEGEDNDSDGYLTPRDAATAVNGTSTPLANGVDSQQRRASASSPSGPREGGLYLAGTGGPLSRSGSRCKLDTICDVSGSSQCSPLEIPAAARDREEFPADKSKAQPSMSQEQEAVLHASREALLLDMTEACMFTPETDGVVFNDSPACASIRLSPEKHDKEDADTAQSGEPIMETPKACDKQASSLDILFSPRVTVAEKSPEHKVVRRIELSRVQIIGGDSAAPSAPVSGQESVPPVGEEYVFWGEVKLIDDQPMEEPNRRYYMF